jgi:hypothetical protein
MTGFKHRGYYSSKPRRGISRVKILFVVWLITFISVLALSAVYVIPIYLIAIPALLALATSAFFAYRITQYAFGRDSRYGIADIWKARFLLGLGVVATGFLLFAFYLGGLFAFVTVPTTIPYYALTSNMFLDVWASILAFLVPIFFGCLIGESYLLYRLGHHYTIGYN